MLDVGGGTLTAYLLAKLPENKYLLHMDVGFFILANQCGMVPEKV